MDASGTPFSRLTWDKGDIALYSLGGMLGPAQFRLPDGRMVSPLHVAPWHEEGLPNLPPILQGLRGDWPCVPFGIRPDAALPSEWDVPRPEHPDPSTLLGHGYGSNHHWTFLPSTPTSIGAAIDYPEACAIARLERRIEVVPGETTLRCSLDILARRDCRLPIGLHPTFRMTTEPGSMRLDIGPHEGVWSPPVDEGPGFSLVEPGQHFASMSSLKDRSGAPLALDRLPTPTRSETLLMATGVSGRATLDYLAEGFRVTLSVDPAVFPNLMLWFSNYGRTASPWSGRHLALGIEPVCAAFDLGAEISASDNPLARKGIRTARDFRAGERVSTSYEIAITPLG
jgi:hypothetical protein